MQIEKRYSVLRSIASLMKIAAIVFIIGGILIGFTLMVMGMFSSATAPRDNQFGQFGGLAGGLLVALGGVFYALILYAFAEFIYLFLDIEENTRTTSLILRAMRQVEGEGKTPLPTGT